MKTVTKEVGQQHSNENKTKSHPQHVLKFNFKCT
jgi:hypothetical protein